MQQNNITSQYFRKPPIIKLTKTDNQLGIEKIDSIKDNHGRHLILLLSGHHMDWVDVYAFLKGNKLILEAPLPFYYENLPLNANHVGGGILEKYAYEDPNIGFSEIILKPGFHYSLLSYDVLNPGLIKIVLRYKKENKYRNHIKLN